ncbi:glycosyltransferase family 4 protein [Oceanimonas doudoroffii]|uniref:glycosyltransferase family 4 protein n=1 Tax=Oceanimonas doudoroffii TaxID=84158 RepID=UPI001140794C|nr:glycosyltransferase family 4 protein [Oceanimonas doudoroffii]
MKIDLRILYLCDFDLKRKSGKDRATYQKLTALSSRVNSLEVISCPFRNPILRFLSVFLLDIKSFFYLLFMRPDVFISRGRCGFFTLMLAKLFNISSVREVHSNAVEESTLLPYKGLKLILVKITSYISHKLDVWADVRIFNHPDLLCWYQSHSLAKKYDFFVYNGFSPSSHSTLSKSDARIRFNIPEEEKVLVFVGSASQWHGVEYVVNLQEQFNLHGDNIKIYFGGGDISAFDKFGFCTNFTPLDDKGCADLIRAADFCLLPVKKNRISPGSPLKLYDYIANERFVIAQSESDGYSDEVERHGVGFSVNFLCPEEARIKIIEELSKEWPSVFPTCKVTWSDRMEEWIDGISKHLQSKGVF